MEFLCFGPLVWEKSGAGIKHLLSDVHLADSTKTMRPGCTVGVRYSNYYLEIHSNTEHGYNTYAELKSVPSFLLWKFSNTLSAHILSLEAILLLVRMQSLKDKVQIVALPLTNLGKLLQLPWASVSSNAKWS